ncbi:MAG: rhodanese-like domain-containing protein [Thiotrichales bacterium]
MVNPFSSAHAPYTDISADELKKLIAEGVPVIDIRTPQEWQQTGVVEGSVLLTLFSNYGGVNPDFVPKLTEMVATDDPVILLCRTGSRTRTAAEALVNQLHYKNVYNVDRGILDWIARGHPVVPPTTG